MTIRTIVRIVLLTLVLAFCALGQTAEKPIAIYLGFGPSLYAQTTPHWAGNLIVGPVVESTGTSVLTVFEGRGATPQTLTYSVMELVRQHAVSVRNRAGKFELAGLAGGGVINTQTASGGSGALGGEITYNPAKIPNWGISVSARAVYSPVNIASGGSSWQPWLMWHVGYTFRE